MHSPFVDIVLKSSVLLLLAALVAGWLTRRSAAAHRHFVWLLVMAGLLVLPVLSVAFPWKLPVMPCVARGAWCAGETEATAIVPEDPVPVEASLPAARAVVPTHDAPRTTYDVAGPSFDVKSLLTLRVLWIGGLCVVGLRLLLAALALARMLRQSRDVTDPTLLASLDYATGRLDIWADVQLLESPRTRIPLTFGLRRPVVVLPPHAATWPAELQRVVLLHELAHVRRGDAFANLVCQVACAVYWFHPLVWGAARRLRIEAERACDDLVLRAGAPPSAYAGHLLSMVQSIATVRAPALALPLAQRSAFEGRVLAILEPGMARHGLTARAVAFGIAALLAIAVPLAALAPATGRAADSPRRSPRLGSKAEAATTPFLSLQRQSRAASSLAEDSAPKREDAAAKVTEVTEVAPQHTPRQEHDGSAAAALIAALNDAVESVRLEAAHALGDRQDTAAINALVAALRRDASREVRKTCAWALGQIEDARAVPGLLQALRDERDGEVRKQVAWALGEIESADAVDGLGAALRGEGDLEIRRMMVWALGEIEDAGAVPYLAPLLRDADDETRKQTAWALGEIESPAAVDPLVAALRGERVVVVREMIVWALGEIEDRRAAPALEAALRDTSLVVRRKAVWAIGELDDLGAAPAGLVAALRDADVEVRRGAVHALAELQDPASVPALVTAMRDADLEVRREAVRALGEIRGSAAIEALVAAMRDEDPEIRRLAARALGNR